MRTDDQAPGEMTPSSSEDPQFEAEDPQFERDQSEVYRQVMEGLRADGFQGVGVADIAAEHQRMQEGRKDGTVALRHIRELLRRHLAGSSEAVGS